MNTGTGPGAITPDGSPVEFYLLLDADDEAEVIASAVPAGASLLELGSGVGRVTHALLAKGLSVVAVDESAEMLAHVRGAETVQARVQELDLGRRFDGVVLASFLLNTPDDGLRRAFLAACARHVAPGGSVLVQWQPYETHERWAPGMGRTTGPIGIVMDRVERVEPHLFSATMRYTHGERAWTQSFESRQFTDEELAAELGTAGLVRDRFLTEDRTWLRAVPAGQ
ncbi:class I SAM-dependent methyltransferase [Nonomuraea soli]|uniref:SAM-dependent methyltransferase n=1 Tax=Nonomuraea soli TaxID=1032476 RepID=A0A7W0CS94_9ACTN|nr:class I SAM-dependent methyltransferase [Nonomuraea soli]MBA2896225.1 SAM-dependent methyltransferase [Nonomuraea soli]